MMTPEEFALSADVSRETMDRLKAMDAVLMDWSSRHNMIARSTAEERWRRHYLDSAQLVPLFPAGVKSIVDLGSGAGFPGLVIAAMLAEKDVCVTLIESRGKKAAFLRAASEAMGLSTLKVIPARIESVKLPKPPDLVTARALARLDKLLAYGAGIQGQNTRYFLLKGQDVGLELTENSPASSSPRILAIANQKGGVGKTTTAINLSTALAAVGEKVLLIDLDPQGNASTGLGVSAASRGVTTYDVLSGDYRLEAAIAETDIPGLRLAPAGVDLAGAEIELIEAERRHFRLADAIEEYGETQTGGEISYILIDCPPSLSLLTINALAASDAVIIPLQCEFFALEGLSQIMRTIETVRTRINPSIELQGVVLTMHDRRNNLTNQVEEDVREHLKDKVYRTVIPRNVRISEAPSHGKPALLYDLKCPGSQAYIQLASEVIQRERARPRPKRELPIEYLKPNADQPRRVFDAAAIEELSGSIKAKGLLQPILVRPLGGDVYEIVAGERRWRAAQKAKLHNVPVVIRELTDEEAAEIALIENVQRVDLNPVEEAEAYQRLTDAFGRTQDEIAKTVGKSRSHVANVMRLLNLPPKALSGLATGKITAGHARALLGASAPDIAYQFVVDRGMSVRQTEAYVKEAEAQLRAPDAAKVGKKQTKSKASGSTKDADTRALERDLSAVLGLDVEIEHSKKGAGSITIDYLTLDQLDDLCRRLMGAGV
ncbi:Chromosome partitioning protein ParA [Durusdinium trenchii]|uniref:Chromosome partitioning protein ParA n=1 Tax=Durusdinium trenchii TaxID=1381693 RepID=A0ABP0LJI4_9DINO